MKCLLFASLSLLTLNSAVIDVLAFTLASPSMKISGGSILTRSLKTSSGFDDDTTSSTCEVSRRDAFVATAATAAASLVMGVIDPSPAMAAAQDTSKQLKQIEKEYEESANTNGAPEKHIPKITLKPVPSNQDLTMVEVLVPHVMDPEKPHWIKAIWLREEKSGDVAVAKIFPATEPSPPTLVCGVPKGVKLTPLLYCNLHGLWKGDTFTA